MVSGYRKQRAGRVPVALPPAIRPIRYDQEHRNADRQGYAAWVKGLFTPVPDLHPEIKAVGTDAQRGSVSIYAIVHGTQTGEGGPVPPTGNKVAAD